MGLHDGHRERLRSRFLNYGADSLCEHEILELLLFYALPRINTNEIAHKLLNEFHSIRNILDASSTDLMRVKGIGSAAADFLCLLSDICNEYTFLQSDPPPVAVGNDLKEYMTEYFEGAVPGLWLLVTLDESLNITGRMCFSTESMLDNNFEVQRITQLLLKSGCTKIALGINRPDKMPIPEISDVLIVRTFLEKYAPLNVHLADCLICSRNRAFSIKNNGAFSLSGDHL